MTWKEESEVLVACADGSVVTAGIVQKKMDARGSIRFEDEGGTGLRSIRFKDEGGSGLGMTQGSKVWS